MTTIQLKPGILVSLKTNVSGGVTYDRVDVREYGVRCTDGSWLRADGSITEIGKTDGAFAGTIEDAQKFLASNPSGVEVEKLPTVDDAGRLVERWETVKTVADPKEHRAACDTRHRAQREINKLCVRTVFGLLCPLAREAELAAAIGRARAIVDAHNATAEATRVGIYVLRGTIATTDEEAARALGEEVRGLVDAMNAGITKLDVEAIRDAASKAAALSEMLSDEQETVISEAVKAARSAARTIAKRVEKEGEQAAVVLADIKRGALEKARLAFLDLSDEQVTPGTEAPAANVQRVAALDLDDAIVPPAIGDIRKANGESTLDVEPREDSEGWWFGMTGPFETRESAIRARDSWLSEKAV